MPDGKSRPPADVEKIMHVSLPISNETALMGSDSFESFGAKTIYGNNFSLSINAESRAEADAIYLALSAGGKVIMPMEDAFWGGYFGTFIDKFGINWMVNFEKNEEE
ncbi:VOC family protein [Flavobacterium sp. KS-LB2]|uniref:VOC family protein n=1 Tax=Flavobacterium sp. KS-LB2 TaxID=3120525 RepID=UPI0030CC09E9